VFVLEAVVLLVQADDVLEENGVPFAVAAVPVEVFDVAQAVAAEGELVCGYSEADVADVEGLFAVKGCAGVCSSISIGPMLALRFTKQEKQKGRRKRRCWLLTTIRNRHLGNRQSIKHTSSIIGQIMNNKPLATIESNAEPPLLPGHLVPADIKRRPLRLLHDIRLQIISQRLSEQIMRVLDCLNGLPRLRLRLN
jgi:hypothetical protein